MLIDNAVISGSLIVSGTLVDFTQVDVISGSIFSGSFVGDGSQLVGVTGAGFPYAGTAVISGSLIVSGSNTDTIDFTNMQSVSGSIFSGSFVGDGSSLTGVTSYTDTDTLDYINSVGVISGSNQLAGTTITGDLTLTGILTAQELHAEFISSSIIYSSGSNKFGDLVTDTHQFTGSIDISGSIQGMISSSAQIASEISGAFDLTGNNTFGSSLTNLHQFTGSLAVSSSNDSYFLGGNVGIGTESPSVKLDVVGDATISGTLTANIITGSLIQLSTGSLAVSASTDSYFIGGGNVGIGTTSPQGKLDLSGTFILSSPETGGTTAENRNHIISGINGKKRIQLSTNTTTFNSYSYLSLYGDETFSDSPDVSRIGEVKINGKYIKLATNNDDISFGVDVVMIDASGNVGIGTMSPHASASLDVTSTTKGFLPPRMTSTERSAISSPPDGLIIYNTTTSLLNYVSGSVWMQVSGSVAP